MERGFKRFLNTFVSIITLFAISFCLLSVWGEGVDVNVNASSTTYSHVYLSLKYFTYDLWVNLEVVSHSLDTYNLVTSYIAIILSLISFISAITIVYIFGIKGIVKTLRNLVEKKPFDSYKEVLIVLITLLAYFNLTSLLASPIAGYNENLSNSAGWGYGLSGFMCYFAAIFLAVLVAFNRFDRRNVTKSISDILILFVALIVPAIWGSLLNGVVYSSNYKVSYGLLKILSDVVTNNFVTSTPYELEQTMLLISAIIGLLIVACGIVIFVSLIKSIMKNEDFKLRLLITFAGACTVLSLAGMVLVNPSIRVLHDVEASNGFSMSFTMSFIVTIIFVVIVVLKSNKRTDDKVVGEQ